MRPSGCGRCRRTPRLPCAGRALALAVFRCGKFPCGSQGRAAVRAEFGLGQIGEPTTRAGVLDGSSTLDTELGSLRILKATAGTTHRASLLLRALRGKENAGL